MNITPTRKTKAFKPNIGSHKMISNNNTTISLKSRKKMKNDMLMNSNLNHINANSPINILININTKPIINQQQHIQQKINQHQLLFTTMAKQISKKDNTSFPSHIVRSLYSKQDEFTNDVNYVSDDVVSTLIHFLPLSSSSSSFYDVGLLTETDCKSFTNPLSINQHAYIIADTPNNITIELDVPVLTNPSNASSNIAFYLGAIMITSNYPYLPVVFYTISPKLVYPCINDVSDHLNSPIITTTKDVTITNIEHKPTTTVPSVTKPYHHHLSHQNNPFNQSILYYPQHTSLPKPQDYNICLLSQSTLIYLSVISPHLYKFKILILPKNKTNPYVITKCGRTRPIMPATRVLHQPISARLNLKFPLLFGSGWELFNNSNIHPLNSHRHLASLKNYIPGNISNHSKHAKMICPRKSRQAICTCHGYIHLISNKLSDYISRTIAFGSTRGVRNDHKTVIWHTKLVIWSL